VYPKSRIFDREFLGAIFLLSNGELIDWVGTGTIHFVPGNDEGAFFTFKTMRFWEAGLNAEQMRAVLHIEGPVLILAGAGSGKTKTLTHRIAYLLAEKQVRPEHILAVTFTNKAAGEMKERIGALLSQHEGASLRMPQYIGTFHSLCSKILRRDIGVLGYSTSFQVLDDQDQQTLAKRVMKELEMNTEQIKPRSLMEAVSRAKNQLLTPAQLTLQAGSYYEELAAKFYERYQAALEKNQSLDFDDLIRLTVELLEKHQEIRERYQAQFRYVMVDEYQDTNFLQYRLVTALSGKYKNVFVIGDDYQSIYGWRQADIRNILEFEKDYPDAAVITLDRNYRSTQIILDAAQGIIDHNANQRRKKLWTDLKEGERITLCPAQDEEAEARFVAQTIEKDIAEKGRQPKDFAVLYRTNAQSRMIEEMLLHRSVSYRVVGGLKFYQRKEVKDVIAYIRLLSNPFDSLALERIANVPARGIGDTTLERWKQASLRDGYDFLTTAHALKSDVSELREGKIKTIQAFADLFSGWKVYIEHTEGLLFSCLLQKVADESGLMKSFEEEGKQETLARVENIQELFSVAKKYDTFHIHEAIPQFLEEVSLSSDTDDLGHEGVQLMTVHSAKGLEFPVVFIVGLEEGVFPHSRSQVSSTELEEERRLMYVGLTRAKEKAYLLYAEQRMIFGSTQVNPPSRFLSEIPPELVEEREMAGGGMMQKRTPGNQVYHRVAFAPKKTLDETASTSSKKPLQVGDVRPGDLVMHPQFGGGLIISVSGTLATIAFKRFGVKKMMLGVAPLSLG
jgi:DNA helicase-2/ATP-dependent DNA helicase PcrA